MLSERSSQLNHTDRCVPGRVKHNTSVFHVQVAVPWRRLLYRSEREAARGRGCRLRRHQLRQGGGCAAHCEGELHRGTVKVSSTGSHASKLELATPGLAGYSRVLHLMRGWLEGVTQKLTGAHSHHKQFVRADLGTLQCQHADWVQQVLVLQLLAILVCVFACDPFSRCSKDDKDEAFSQEVRLLGLIIVRRMTRMRPSVKKCDCQP